MEIKLLPSCKLKSDKSCTHRTVDVYHVLNVFFVNGAIGICIPFVFNSNHFTSVLGSNVRGALALTRWKGHFEWGRGSGASKQTETDIDVPMRWRTLFTHHLLVQSSADEVLSCLSPLHNVQNSLVNLTFGACKWGGCSAFVTLVLNLILKCTLSISHIVRLEVFYSVLCDYNNYLS